MFIYRHTLPHYTFHSLLRKASEIQENKKRGKHSLPNGSVSYDGFALSCSVSGGEYYLYKNWSHHHGDEE